MTNAPDPHESSMTGSATTTAPGPDVRPRLLNPVRSIAISVLALVCASPGLSGQDVVSIVGRTFDAVSQQPVAGVRIRVSGTERSDVTDAAGTFELHEVAAADSVVLRLEHEGYGTRTEAVSIDDTDRAVLRVLLARKAVPLKPIAVEIVDRRGRAASAERDDRNVITRAEIEEMEGSVGDLVGLLSQEVPGVRVSRRGAAPARFCLEIRGVAKSLQDDPDACLYPLVMVDQSRINSATLGSVFQSMALDEIQRIEVIRGAQAGVEYGSGSQYGVLRIDTKVRSRPSTPARAAGSTRIDVRPSESYNWSIERESHPFFKTLGAAFVGNAVGLAAGLWIGSRCMDYDVMYQDFFVSRCAGLPTAGVRLAAIGLPLFASTYAARWAGRTEASVGNWKKSAGLATIFLVPGYIMAASGLGEEGSPTQTAGKIMFSVGVPLATATADHLFRNLSFGAGGGE